MTHDDAQLNDSPQPMTSRQSQDFTELLDKFCAQELTEPEALRFDALLAEYPEARAVYLDCMAVEAELHAGHAVARQPGVDRMAPASQHSGAAATRRTWSSWLAIAASLIGVAFLSSWSTALWIGDKQVASEDAAGNPADTPLASSYKADLSGDPSDALGRGVGQATPAIAEITATRNCRWRGAAVGCGDKVHPGQRLDLLQGVAELLFDSGVAVLLEGPAKLDVDADGSLSMRSGRLCVDSPEEAESLQIRAGRMVLAQSGAACGVLSDAVGGGEVHVFRGNVHAVVLDDGGQHLQACSLAGGAGGRLKPAAREFTPIQAHGDLFVRSLSPSTGPQDGLYAVESFQYPAGPISAQNGGFGWAGPWAEIESSPTPAGETTNTVAERSLAWPGVPPLGARLTQTGQANRVRRVLSTTFKGVFDAAGLVENRDAHRLIGKENHTVYVAAVQRVNKTDDVFYGLELNRGDGNANRVLCVGNGADGAGYAATSNYNNYIGDRGVSLGDENTAANLIVIRIDYGEDDRDRALVYRNPRSLTEEYKCRPDAELTGNFAFDRISFGNFEGSKTHEVDDLRIGAAFRVVTGQRSFLQAPLASTDSQPRALLANWFGASGAEPDAAMTSGDLLFVSRIARSLRQ